VAVGNVITALAVPGQVGPTLVNMIYGGSLSTPVYTFHLPYGSGIAALAPTFSLAAGATANPASGWRATSDSFDRLHRDLWRPGPHQLCPVRGAGADFRHSRNQPTTWAPRF